MESILIESSKPRHRRKVGRVIIEEGASRANIVRMCTRMLRPYEYGVLHSVASTEYRVLFNTALLTGMRVVELRLFLKNPF